MATLFTQMSNVDNEINKGTPICQIFESLKEPLLQAPLYEKYFFIGQMWDRIGPWEPYLDLAYKMIKMPSFKYDKNQNPFSFLCAFSQSSYWLDKELFDEDLIEKQVRQSSLMPAQRIHLKLLNIANLLIDKGFPLNEETLTPILNNKNTPIQEWVVTFLRQCRKRNSFLKHRKICHHSPIKPEKSKSREHI